MAIPFAVLLKKAKARFGVGPGALQAVAHIAPAPREKPSSDRLSKTVMPNATRTLAPSDPFEMAGNAHGNVSVAAAPSVHRMVAVGRTQQAKQHLPPAVALALEPKIERTISLALIDLVPHMPSDVVKPSASFDTEKRVLLKAADVEKGMTSGAPKVSLAFIYQQVPDIFMRKIEASDPTQIALPVDKVLEQFSNARLRRDQVTEEPLPQVDTPFLQVTIEDTRKFGGTMPPAVTAAMPIATTKLAPATAQTLSDAEPEAAATEKFTPTSFARPETAIKPVAPVAHPRPYGEALPPRKAIKMDAKPFAFEEAAASTDRAPVEEIPPAAPDAPLRISIKFPPNGAGEHAIKRVPASGAPPVPISDTTAAQPVRIPFKLNRDTAKTVVPEAVVGSPEGVPASSSNEPQVTLPLRPILEALPPMQLQGDTASVGEATISFAFSIIQPQLASGRIGIAPKQFRDAMPEEHRAIFNADALEVPVALPLAEVLKNMPASSLQLRDDQEEVVMREEFQTPFALKAQEDAKRFAAAQAPVADAAPAVEAQKITPVQSPAVEKFDAKKLVARATELPGVASCAITFNDGLSLAGNIPSEMGIEGISAMAPSMLQRMEKHMSNTKLGQLSAMTLHCTESPVTFVVCGNICLTAVHNGQELTADTRGKLTAMTQEISQTYSQPETANVDH